MFGSGLTLCKWSAEGKPVNKTRTHVSVYDAEKTKAGSSGLDREGMILVALMSGGDYAPDGIPGCGPKLACEAARAGFGRDLCVLSARDDLGFKTWRERLVFELRTNESMFFRQKRPALSIPEDFPDRKVLGYYTNPVVSSNERIESLRSKLEWDAPLDLPALRKFCADAFDWICISGAKKFIRNLAPALLVRQLRLRGENRVTTSEDHEAILRDESKLVKGLHGKRNHPDTDNTSELRVSFSPVSLVSIDLSREDPDPERPPPIDEAPDSDAPIFDEDGTPCPPTPTKRARGPSTYDPTELDKIWVLESFVKVGVPLKVQDWEENFRDTRRYLAMKQSERADKAKQKKRTKDPTKQSGMSTGAMDRFTRVTKLTTSESIRARKSKSKSPETRVLDGTKPSTEKTLNKPLEPFTGVVKATEGGSSTCRRRKSLDTDLIVLSQIGSAPKSTRLKVTKTSDRTEVSTSLQAPHSPSRPIIVIDITPSCDTRQPLRAPIAQCRASDDTIIDLPPSVTRRRRRSPFQRDKTKPRIDSLDLSAEIPLEALSSLQQQAAGHLVLTEPDLFSSPCLPSPSSLRNNGPNKRVKAATSSDKQTLWESKDGLDGLLSSPSRQAQVTSWVRSSPDSRISEARSGKTQLLEVDPVPTPPQLLPSATSVPTSFDHQHRPETASSAVEDPTTLAKTRRNPLGPRTSNDTKNRSPSQEYNPNRQPLQASHPASAKSTLPRSSKPAFRDPRFKKREIRLRDSLEGAWKTVEVEAVDLSVTARAEMGLKEAKARGVEASKRSWRESQVEVLDLTSP